jgi:hypothetical protein
MLNKEDVERIVGNVLSELRINVCGGDFSDPNRREVTLTLHGKIISTAYFDVVETRDYEG